MRITLIHPPDGMLPTVAYASLPCLASCLKERGHEVTLKDVNLDVFESVMRREKLHGWYDRAEAVAQDLSSRPTLADGDAHELRRLQRLLAIPRDVFDEVEDSLAVMRDLDRFLNPDVLNRAFDVVRAAQRFAYSVGPQSFTESPKDAERVLSPPASGPLPDPPIDAYQPIVEEILAEAPELIGVSVPYDSSIFYGLKLMRLIKELAPEIPVIVGGAGMDSFAFPLTKEPAYFQVYDWAMLGEGELAFPDFVDALERGEDPRQQVRNLRWREADGKIGLTEMVMIDDLNQIPSPDFTGLPLDRYLLPDPVATFQTSRGCYYGKCTFCSELFRKGFRMRRPDLVVEDMVAIYEKTGIRHFQLWDSLAPPKTLKKVALEVKKRGLPFEWMAETKFERPFRDERMIETLAEGGCTFLLFGFESASSRVLDLIDKGNDLDDVERILALMKKHNIRAGTSWFIGFPGESEREADTTFDFIGRRRDRIQFSNYTRTYDIGIDTIVYENQERFGVQVFQTEEGSLDYRYRDGSDHWDRGERDEAFHVRGDFHVVKNHLELHYAKVDVPTSLRVTGQHRMGPLMRHVEPAHLQDVSFQRTRECVIRSFERHPFQPDADGLAVAYHMITGHVFDLDSATVSVLDLLEQPRSVEELMSITGGSEQEVLVRLELAVNRGLVRIVADPAHLRWLPETELREEEPELVDEEEEEAVPQLIQPRREVS